MSKGKKGFILLDCLLGVLLIMVTAAILYNSAQLKSRIKLAHDEEELIELWQESDMREIWQPEVIEDTILLPTEEVPALP